MIIGSPYTPYSIYFRGTIQSLNPKPYCLKPSSCQSRPKSSAALQELDEVRVHSDFPLKGGQGVFLCTLKVCTLGFWVPKPWNMALNKGIWDPKLRGTNIKGTNLKSLSGCKGSKWII